MAKDSLPGKTPARRPGWFTVLLALDLVMLGGLVVWRLVLSLLDNIMARQVGTECLGVIPHIQDELFIYWVAHSGLAVLLAVVTIWAVVYLKTVVSEAKPAA